MKKSLKIWIVSIVVLIIAVSMCLIIFTDLFSNDEKEYAKRDLRSKEEIEMIARELIKKNFEEDDNRIRESWGESGREAISGWFLGNIDNIQHLGTWVCEDGGAYFVEFYNMGMMLWIGKVIIDSESLETIYYKTNSQFFSGISPEMAIGFRKGALTEIFESEHGRFIAFDKIVEDMYREYSEYSAKTYTKGKPRFYGN